MLPTVRNHNGNVRILLGLDLRVASRSNSSVEISSLDRAPSRILYVTTASSAQVCGGILNLEPLERSTSHREGHTELRIPEALRVGETEGVLELRVQLRWPRGAHAQCEQLDEGRVVRIEQGAQVGVACGDECHLVVGV